MGGLPEPIRVRHPSTDRTSVEKCHAVVVYYESLKRALKTKTIYGYRCDERLKTNVVESTFVESTRCLFIMNR